MKKDTQWLNAGRDKKFTGAAVNPPLVRATTIVFESIAEMAAAGQYKEQGVEYYGRRGTATTFAFNAALCELEGAAGSYAYSCGTAAITSSLLAFLSSGDHLLMVDSVYQPTRSFCLGTLKRLGVEVSFYDPLAGQELEAQICANTKVIYMESPGSLSMEAQDLVTIVELAKRHNVVTMMDNTYATPFNFKPLDVGVDISIHSATKYLSGHSDVMLGVASANKRCWAQLQARSYELGQCASVDDIYIVLRGLRTLAVRMRQHEQNALHIAKWLQAQEVVERVLHPAFESSPGHKFFERDFSGSSGLFSIVLTSTSVNAMQALVDGLKHFKIGFSWGGYESLALPVDSSVGDRLVRPWEYKNMLRLHIGLEDPEDLIDDLSAGLNRYIGTLEQENFNNA